MRRTRLDEIPQLLNVITGQMALIGPRPETPEYVDDGDPRWQAVLSAKPGIAGPTQLLIHDYEAEHLGRDPERYLSEILTVKLAIDAWYIRNASPMVDLLVAIAVVERFGLGKRTTVLHRRVCQAIPEIELLAW
jgi:lipopolysaccharide/colanic/teichoic acid biosynthesis glycosyltransferase